MNTNLSQRHEHITTAVLAALVGLTGLATVLDAALTATGHPVLVGLGAAVLAVLVAFGRWVARRMWERREDAADALTAAAWRAQNMPHLTPQIECDHSRRSERAGVA
jgi:protein-S-isoprenylcysteine O-methyltransferase Ste14